MRRSKLSLLLVIAFLLALVAPVQASWACPDGTPCVADRQHGFVCASERCGSHGFCCQVEEPTVCHHGALPAVTAPTGGGPVLQRPDHCRFRVSAKPNLTALADQAGKLLWLSLDLLPAPAPLQITAPAARPAWRSEYTLGYRPPPLLPTGPSRAPPVA